MNDNPHLNDRDLMALAGEIDRLAFEDRGDAALEGRIYAATLPVLQNASRPALRLVGTGSTPVVVEGRGSTRTALRIAAGFAIAATAGLTWLATHRTAPSATPGSQVAAVTPVNHSTVDDWTIASAVLEDELNDELSILSTKASALRSDLDSIGTGDAYEEAM